MAHSVEGDGICDKFQRSRAFWKYFILDSFFHFFPSTDMLLVDYCAVSEFFFPDRRKFLEDFRGRCLWAMVWMKYS